MWSVCWSPAPCPVRCQVVWSWALECPAGRWGRGAGRASLKPGAGRLQGTPAGDSGNGSGAICGEVSGGGHGRLSESVDTGQKAQPTAQAGGQHRVGAGTGGARRPGLRVTGADGRPAATPQPTGVLESPPRPTGPSGR